MLGRLRSGGGRADRGGRVFTPAVVARAALDALLDGVSAALGTPAAYSGGRRGGQIMVSAAFPLVMAIAGVAGVIWVGKNRATMPDAAEAFSLANWTGLWLVALASAAGS